MRVEARDLSFSYGEKTVLKNVSIELTGERPVLLYGSSGGGKTTLLMLLAGLLTPQGGEIRGIDPSTRVAVMFQEDRLFESLSVYRNLRLVKNSLSKEEAGALLKEVGLGAEILSKRPGTLSGGMRRRVALLRALIFDSQVLLMDEPFQGLDEESRFKAISMTRRYLSGKPALIISHEPEDGIALCAKEVNLDEINGVKKESLNRLGV